MLSVTSAYNYKTAQPDKEPVYLLHIEDKYQDYIMGRIADIVNPTYPLKPWITAIKGNSQKIIPEEGSSSIGQMTISIQDGSTLEYLVDSAGQFITNSAGEYLTSGEENGILTLIATDAGNLHRKRATIKAGYVGMAEDEMANPFTGYITDIKHWNNYLGYDFIITDPQRYFQKKIFLYATNSAPVYLSGNPLNIFLGVLTSTGSGTNGDYDWYDEYNAVGLDVDDVDVSGIEEQRDHWFPGEKWSMTITEPIVAKQFLEDQFCKICNMYPIVRGDGVFTVKVYHGPVPTESWQGFDEDVIIGLPEWDLNLSEMINKVQAKYDYNEVSNEYEQDEWHIDSESFTLRKDGKKPLTLESKGVKTTLGGAAFIERRVLKVFDRYANPPPKIKAKTFFSRHLSEVGDIPAVSHSKIPDLSLGVKGISSHWMEITNRSIDWNKGYCNFEFLHTSWKGQQFMQISPSMRVNSGINEYQFTVFSGDGLHYSPGYQVDLIDFYARSMAANFTVNSIVGDVVTVTSMGVTPASGYFVQFASSYDNLTDYQKQFWAVDSAYQIMA